MRLPDGASLPKVSALMGAYNYGKYIVEAIESAMAQDYPAELLELVIVDDGSTDNTAELVRDCITRHPGRITFVQQPNAGATAATNRARREATGDLIALLDADDVWLVQKTRKQVDLMLRRPELGLVFSQMSLIDGEGATLHRGYGHRESLDLNQFARVLWENVAVQSSLIIEADLFDEIPPDAPYADWWLCLRAAQFKRIEYLREDLVLYRWHGANITGGVGGAKALREAQKGIAFQRWVARSFSPDELMSRLTPEELAYVWTGLENQAFKGLSGLQSQFGQLATVTPADREAAAHDAAAGEAAADAGDLDRAAFLLWRARMGDPFDADFRARFTELVTAAAADAARLPDLLAGSTGFNVLTDAELLLSDDQHLRDWADVMRGARATLVIDASRLAETTAATALQNLIARRGLADDHEVPMIAIIGALQPPQRHRVRRGVVAVYGTATLVAGDPSDTPVFSAETLTVLRELSTRPSGNGRELAVMSADDRGGGRRFAVSIDDLDSDRALIDELRAAATSGVPFGVSVLPGSWGPTQVGANAQRLLGWADSAAADHVDVVVLAGPLTPQDDTQINRSCTARFGNPAGAGAVASLPWIAPGNLASWLGTEHPGRARVPLPVPDGFGVNVIGPVSSGGTDGVAARATVAALLTAGIKVAIVDLAARDADSDARFDHLRILDGSQPPHPFTVVHLQPDAAAAVRRARPLWLSHGCTCIFVDWALRDIPQRWESELAHYAAVLAPTSQVAAAVNRRVAVPVVPFPVTPEPPGPAALGRRELGLSEDSFTVMASADSDAGEQRANGIAAVIAVESARAAGVDATLVLQVTGVMPQIGLVRALRRLPRNRVVVSEGRAHEQSLYAACDAYISMHRAEGMAIGLQRVMRLGKAAIATGWSGNTDFMDSSCASLVSYTLAPVMDTLPAYGPANFGAEQLWADPDPLDAARQLRSLAQDPARRIACGTAARTRLEQRAADWLASAPQTLLEVFRTYAAR